jgi:hypothetical protein
MNRGTRRCSRQSQPRRAGLGAAGAEDDEMCGTDGSQARGQLAVRRYHIPELGPRALKSSHSACATVATSYA